MKQYFILTVTFVLSLSAVETFAAKKVTDSTSKDALMIELTGKDPSKVDETTLYAEIFNAYRSNDEIGFKSRTLTMCSTWQDEWHSMPKTTLSPLSTIRK